MKVTFILAFLCLITSSAVFGQEIKYADLATAKRGEYTSYVGTDGAVYKIGDRIKIGVPSSNKTFAFITEGDGLILAITNLLASASGTETEIKRIYVSGNKRAALRALRCSEAAIRPATAGDSCARRSLGHRLANYSVADSRIHVCPPANRY